MQTFEPKQFGKYYLLEKLAVGGMAEIYKAKTFGVDGFEKLLVMKRILPHCSADKDFITMLVDEAKLSVTLSHANVVQVYDLGKVGDDYFISMEYISGVNLRDIIYRCREKNIRIPEELSTYILSEVCKGLDYAHRKTDASGNPLNIVHRDVSPQNILISYEGEVKIVDFGIAKAAMNISHTMAGILKGKIAYMSPEQALGKSIDYHADIFSTGIVLYEALTGEKLFTGESQFEVLKKIRTTKMDLTKLPGTMPDGLKNVLARSLAYLPKDRYASAGDMQIDLTRYLYTSHVDFTPQKLAAFIKELFFDEISKQRERGALEQVLEAQTSSINVSEEALQENLVHREDTSPTIQASEHTSASSYQGREATEKTSSSKKSLFQRLAATATVLTLLVGVGFAYFKFIHPQLTGKTDITRHGIETGHTGTANVFSNPSGAKIFLDGKDTDLTTPSILENLTIGKIYKIKLAKEKFDDFEKDVAINSAEPVMMETELRTESGTLEVKSDPDGAMIYVNGLPTNQSTPAILKDLQLNSDLKITLVKPEYKDLDQSVKLSNSKPQTLIAKLIKATTEMGSVMITSTPPGAQVFYNGRDTGMVTPSTISNIPVGEKSNIRLAKSGFENFTQTVTLKDAKPLDITAELKPTKEKPVAKAKAAVTTANVTSRPSGARIYLNGKSTGLRTPATLKNLDIGKNYSVKLAKPKFEVAIREFTATDNAASVRADLKEIAKAETPITPEAPKPVEKPSEPDTSYRAGAETATLSLSSDPSGAEVFVNAEFRGTTPITITSLQPGTVRLLINKEGKARYSQKVSLKPGEKKNLGTVKLGELYGSVSISSSPSRARVIFDGEDIGAKTPVTIKKVRRDKQHNIKLVLGGYRAWERSFDMQDADDKKFNVIMEE
ncbi:MAG: hypothetical protein COV46_00880 [Deltaproteobacteria bacterium CG11_big_fil_rev_8_21_14_0_20_49_13]|nr:MAG: hypothetical protein COV46_00880 [Deltaproteobacteria bacterium CG11_big_fil_rev_8_21_14_0_20_49_13]